MENIKLEEIMTALPITVSFEDNLSTVSRIFENKNIHHIPVIDESHSLCGIISKTDLDRVSHGMTLFNNPSAGSYNKALFECTLATEVMTKDVHTLKPNDTVQFAYNVFRANKYRAIPIVLDRKLVGIVTPLDIIDYLMANR